MLWKSLQTTPIYISENVQLTNHNVQPTKTNIKLKSNIVLKNWKHRRELNYQTFLSCQKSRKWNFFVNMHNSGKTYQNAFGTKIQIYFVNSQIFNGVP